MVSKYAIPIGIPRVDGLSIGPPNFKCHNDDYSKRSVINEIFI